MSTDATEVKQPMDLIGAIIAFEEGELEGEDTIRLFCHLANNGVLGQLQGHYGRCMRDLVDSGAVKRNGEGFWAPDWDRYYDIVDNQ